MEDQAIAVVETKNDLSIQNLMETAYEFAQASISKNTKRTYEWGKKSFLDWCADKNVDPMVTESKEALIAFYASDKASTGKFKVASITCYIAAICSWYLEHGVAVNMKHPSLKNVLKGIRNTLTVRPTRKDPILTEDLRSMVEAIPIDIEGVTHLAGIRDRALLLLGFTGAFRRSELVGLNLEDITFTRDGFIALVRKSKTDQEGAGKDKIIPYGANPITCPVRALQDWLAASKITTGPLFRRINRHGHLANEPLTGKSVAIIIKRNPYIKGKEEKYAGHSLRAGFVTQAAINNVSEDLIMQQTGHKSSNTLKMYIRRGKSFKETAAAMVGL